MIRADLKRILIFWRRFLIISIRKIRMLRIGIFEQHEKGINISVLNF